MEESESYPNCVSTLPESVGPHALVTGTLEGHSPLSLGFLKLDSECAAAIRRARD